MKKKLISVILCLSMMLTMVSCSSIKNNKSSLKGADEFEVFCDRVFKEMVGDSAFNAHFQIKDTSKYGIVFEQEDYNLGECSLEYMEEYYDIMAGYLNELKEYDRYSLSESQKITYDTLEDYFETNAAYDGLEMYTNLFGISQGLVANLSTNFIEYVFYEKEDVNEYLLYLKDTPRYVEEALNVLKTQAQEGLFMSTKAADEIISQCEAYISETEEPLILTFENKISQLDISDVEKKAYIKTNKEYVEKYYLPVYTEIKNVVNDLKKYSDNQKGLCEFGDDAKKYYEAIVRDKTSMDITPEELVEYLNHAMSDAIKEMSGIVVRNGKAYDEFLEFNAEYDNPSEVLEYILNKMDGDFPKSVTENYSIEYQLPVCEIEGVVAYYVSSRIDDISINNIKVNSSAVADDGTTLYKTMAHEGFPGHLYQFTAMYDNDEICNLRKILDFIGSTEGWAEYASDITMDYWEDCSEDAVRLIQINDILSYILCSRIDIGINYEGWGYEETYDYLSSYLDVTDDFDSEDNVVVSLYTSAIGDPGVYFPYTVGHLKMDELRDTAKEELSDKFDLKAFNTWIISEMGITSFDVYEDNLSTWIKLQK